MVLDVNFPPTSVTQLTHQPWGLTADAEVAAAPERADRAVDVEEEEIFFAFFSFSLPGGDFSISFNK